MLFVSYLYKTDTDYGFGNCVIKAKYPKDVKQYEELVEQVTKYAEEVGTVIIISFQKLGK